MKTYKYTSNNNFEDPRTYGMLRYMSKTLDMPYDPIFRPKPKVKNENKTKSKL